MSLPRLYPILDHASVQAAGVSPDDAAAAILEAGAGMLQFRLKGAFTRRAVAQVESVAALCRRHGALLVLNDRADIARIAGAALHLGQDDLPASMARRILGVQACIGLSTHNEPQLRAAREQPVDYYALGPIFPTSSKHAPDPVLGLSRLSLLRPLADRPLVAIGGITRDNALSVLQAGADSLAVIGDLLPQPCSPDAIRQRVEEWLALVGP